MAEDPPYESWSLNEWQELFMRIYKERNEKLTRIDILSQMIKDIGDISEALREGDLNKLTIYIPSVFAWLCGYASRGVAKNIEDAIWKKYPRVCPYCENTKDCICLPWLEKEKGKVPLETRLEEFYKQQRPSTLDNWAEMFETIYGKRNRELTSIEAICMHLFEEVSEVIEKEYRGAAVRDLQLELADIFGWLFALLIKLKYMADFLMSYFKPSEGLTINLSKILWDKYKEGCPTCKSEKCICKVRKPTHRVER